MKTLPTQITIAEVSNGTSKAIIVIDHEYKSKNFKHGRTVFKRTGETGTDKFCGEHN